ncbi:hypothetical protein GGF46_004676 [Coemansia sp. RSA 552]|nr:hypothetical protein GGF46_004676 [Coemansia sp. RSA 552]
MVGLAAARRLVWTAQRPVGMARLASMYAAALTQRHGAQYAGRLVHTTAVVGKKGRTGAVQADSDVMSRETRVDPTIPGQSLTLAQKARSLIPFYKDGLRELWSNVKAEKGINQRIARGEEVTRAEYQVHLRTRVDRLRLVPFAIMAVALLELVPFVLVMFPALCPTTCLMYAQMMRKANKLVNTMEKMQPEIRDRLAKVGLSIGDFETVESLKRTAASHPSMFAVDGLSSTDLHLVCRYMKINGLWARQRDDRLRKHLHKHLEIVLTDDHLLNKEQLVDQLPLVELHRACYDRGIPSATMTDVQARKALINWISLTMKLGSTQLGVLPAVWARLVLFDRPVKSS